MDAQSILAIAFILILTLLLFFKRSKLTLHKLLFPFFYIVMYKSRFGLGFMSYVALRAARLVSSFGYVGVVAGFLGMALIAYTLINSLYLNVVSPGAVPGVAPVLPIHAKGVFYVPFFYWVISIFILAIVHEFAHGVVARRHGVRMKASGFAFIGVLLPIIPAAFVEPDEAQLRNKPVRHQLAVFSAGSFANIVLGLFVLALFLVVTPIASNSFINPSGILVSGVVQGSPASQAGISEGDVITAVDNVTIAEVGDFTSYMDSTSPGQAVLVNTKNSSYQLVLGQDPNNRGRGYLGVYAAQSVEIKPAFKDYTFIPLAVFWLLNLMYWLYVLNIGVGLFNLVPIGPLDGGRMMHLAMKKLFKLNGDSVAGIVSMLFVLLVVVNLAFSFVQ